MSLTYDDITLVPQYSNIESRKNIKLTKTLSNFGEFNLPVIGSPMDTVCGADMCIALAKSGGFGVLHRYASIEDRVEMAKQIVKENCVFAAAIGAVGNFFDEAGLLYEAG